MTKFEIVYYDSDYNELWRSEVESLPYLRVEFEQTMIKVLYRKRAAFITIERIK